MKINSASSYVQTIEVGGGGEAIDLKWALTELENVN